MQNREIVATSASVAAPPRLKFSIRTPTVYEIRKIGVQGETHNYYVAHRLGKSCACGAASQAIFGWFGRLGLKFSIRTPTVYEIFACGEPKLGSGGAPTPLRPTFCAYGVEFFSFPLFSFPSSLFSFPLFFFLPSLSWSLTTTASHTCNPHTQCIS